MTRLLTCTALALSLLFPALAGAQTDSDADLPERVINIGEGETLTGELYRPGQELIEGSRGIRSSSLVPVRMELIDKIVDSWDDI